MTYEFIQVTSDGPITTITLNRPERLNALHPPAHFECHDALDAFDRDPDQWLAILTGTGTRAFSAGNDLKYQASGGSMAMPPTGFAGLTNRFNLAKPVIAAVDGLALGGGFETVLACDMVIASEPSEFALPEPRVGLIALAGGLHRLPRAIGMKRAMDLVLTSRRVGAAEGLELGFVNRVVAPGDTLAAARAIAEDICKSGPLAIRAAKQVVQWGADQPLPAALAMQWNLAAVQQSRGSEDALEGPRAFAEKRAPLWRGR